MTRDSVDSSNTARVRLRSKGKVYTTAMGLCLATLLIGLGLPFVVGSRPDAVTAGPRAFTPPETTTSTPDTAPTTEAVELQDGAGVEGDDGTIPDAPDHAIGDHDTTSGGAEPGRPVETVLTATDIGVDAESIRVGVLVPDLGTLTNVPGVGDSGFDERTYRALYKAFADDLNARGGVLGRRIELVYHTVALEDPEQSNRRACVHFTQDEQVFAIFDSAGQIDPETLDCIHRGSGAPAISQVGSPRRFYQGALFTVHTSTERLLATYLEMFHSMGELQGKRIALVEAASDQQLMNDVFIPALRERGYELTHRTTLSDNPGEVASQLPLEVNRMKAGRVQVVFLLSLAAASGLLVQNANAQGFHPRWLTSDFNGGTLDFTAGLFPANTDALGLTAERTGEWRSDIPEPAYDARCRERFNAHSSIGDVERRTTTRDNPYEHAVKVCTHFDIFETAAAAAGPNLTRAGFISAIEHLGTIELGHSAPGSFSPGKHDARDFARLVQFRADCPGDRRNCYMPVTDFVRGI